MKTIGFAGTAKNTGKTTTAAYLLALCEQAGLRVALTSIGYDGENIDNVTGLPKPRYQAAPGLLLATAEGCLKSGTAGFVVLEQTSVKTVLGRVLLVKITSPGTVVLAGPNRAADLLHVFTHLETLGADVVMVDGALNRLVPLAAAGGLVLSTGAAFDPDIDRIAEHAGALAEMLSLPLVEGSPLTNTIRVTAHNGHSTDLAEGSLLSRRALAELITALPFQAREIIIPGACHPELFETLLAYGGSGLAGCRFLFGSPLKLIASGGPLHWQHILQGLPLMNQSAGCLQASHLQLVTVNPFYPDYRSTGRYEPAWVDKTHLLEAVRARVNSVPVVNIRVEEDLPDLLQILGLNHQEAPHA